MTLMEKARTRREKALKVTRGLRANVFFDPDTDQAERRGSVLEMLSDLSARSGSHAIVRRAA